MLELTRQAMAGPSALAAGPDTPVAKQALAEQNPQILFSQSVDEAEQALELEAWLLEPTVDVLPIVVQGQPVTELAESEGLAEQWLLGMLGQREVTLGARETTVEPRVMVSGSAPRPLPVESFDGFDGFDALDASLAPRALRALAAAPFEPALVGSVAAKDSPVTLSAALTAPMLASLERLGAIEPRATPVDGPDALLLGQLQSSAPTQAALRLSAEAPQTRLNEQILQTLRQSIEVQVRQNIQQATVRLDPPELGSLEIFLSHESGRLQIHITAANADVSRLLQQTSERLRQDLVSANYLQVNVQVGSEGQSGRQQQRSSQHTVEAVIAQAATLDEQTREQVTGDVLVTV